ncbi:MAG TPA: hypothetical protein VFV33_03025 [Gemmatimonadaceae bacterium]|nr:hypothetical protein [Gemmatimonadaceae bacterium]
MSETIELVYVEFEYRRDGMIHAMEGGLWLHRHVWKGRPMAHLVSTSREQLLAYGRVVGLPDERLQFKPLKDPRTTERREAWHWDLVGRFLPAKHDAGDMRDRRAAAGGDRPSDEARLRGAASS